MDETLWKYAEGDMNEDEKALFETKLKNDSNLREELDRIRKIQISVTEYRGQMNRSLPESFEDMVMAKIPRRKPAKRFVYGGVIAAAAAIVMMFYLNKPVSNDGELLAADSTINKLKEDIESLSPSSLVGGTSESAFYNDDYSAPEDFTLTGDDAQKVLAKLETSDIL